LRDGHSEREGEIGGERQQHCRQRQENEPICFHHSFLSEAEYPLRDPVISPFHSGGKSEWGNT
jgi:hypothetical protein